MIDFHEILNVSCTRAGLSATTQKAALEAASELVAAANPQILARHLLEELLARERLGSTGLGAGVAIPHCRLEECNGPTAAMIRLTRPVDFEAPDGRGVDLLFVLAVPADEERVHLEILGALAHTFDHAPNLEALRRADTDESLRDVILSELAGLATTGDQ